MRPLFEVPSDAVDRHLFVELGRAVLRSAAAWARADRPNSVLIAEFGGESRHSRFDPCGDRRLRTDRRLDPRQLVRLELKVDASPLHAERQTKTIERIKNGQIFCEVQEASRIVRRQSDLLGDRPMHDEIRLFRERARDELPELETLITRSLGPRSGLS